ncbi:uncharacterized protein [Gossypium hirsutum]|uniref:CCHC-type domain-containing protein n=1 Tax=Gossypium hirsutum TaxID=3635 RepID=A0ABM2YQW3_GOSHI|nr:uncharacterized protein LOC121205075 [Gossypium hirsutum]
MACSPDDYLICAVSLLKEEAYNWWETIEAVVPAEKITWEFFQNEFKKKYVVPERSGKSRPRQSDYKASDKPAVSVGSVQNTQRPKCQHCGRSHPSECRSKLGACYKCGVTDHFIRDCPQLQVEEVEQREKQKILPQKGRRSGQSSATGATRSGMKDTASRSEVRAPARTYAIRAREEATTPDVIAASEKNLFVELTDYDVQVTNPLGQSVVVNLIYHNCPLKVKGCDFPADLMLLPFREFDIIWGMDWLMKHDAVVNCREKRISLKCQTGDIVLVESGNLDDMLMVYG